MSKYCLSSIKNTCNKCSKFRRVFAWRAFIACYKLFVAVAAACAAALTLAEALALSHTQSRTYSLTQSLTHTFGSLALSLILRLSRRSRRRTRARAGAGALFALQQCCVVSWPQFVFDDRCVWWCRACAVCKRPLSFLSKLFGQLRDFCERPP